MAILLEQKLGASGGAPAVKNKQRVGWGFIAVPVPRIDFGGYADGRAHAAPMGPRWG